MSKKIEVKREDFPSCRDKRDLSSWHYLEHENKELKQKLKVPKGFINVPLHMGQLRAIQIAVSLRIDALNENGDKDQTYGWKIIHRKILKAIEELEKGDA